MGRSAGNIFIPGSFPAGKLCASLPVPFASVLRREQPPAASRSSPVRTSCSLEFTKRHQPLRCGLWERQPGWGCCLGDLGPARVAVCGGAGVLQSPGLAFGVGGEGSQTLTPEPEPALKVLLKTGKPGHNGKICPSYFLVFK